MSQTFNARGNYADFSVNMDDRQLRRAINALGDIGETMFDAFLIDSLNKNIIACRKELKSKAGALANVRVPSPKGLPFKASKNIHVKVGDALKLHKNKKMQYTVHTGKSIQTAAVGVLGQRGGRIGHIVAKGLDPFRYGNLPMLVMSSTKWYKATGQAGWPSTGMRMRMSHPGFYNTFDYMGFIEEHEKKQFIKEAYGAIILPAAVKAGFKGSEVKISGGGGLSSSVGGKGIMAARRG